MLPPDTYFIGDPIFALSNEHLTELSSQLGRRSSAEFEIDGHQGWCAVTPTEEMTATSTGVLYEIQSGRLAVIPSALVKEDDELEVELDDVGDIKMYKRVFTCEETPTTLMVGRTSISLEATGDDDELDEELDYVDFD
jgi:hypothetical protein